jgi:hypothetical protein
MPRDCLLPYRAVLQYRPLHLLITARADEVRTRKHTHTRLCYQRSRESHTECLVGFEASTPRDLAWAWCVCSVPWNPGARIDELPSPQVIRMTHPAFSNLNQQ